MENNDISSSLSIKQEFYNRKIICIYGRLFQKVLGVSNVCLRRSFNDQLYDAGPKSGSGTKKSLR